MKINSKPYGSINIDERQIINFPLGIFGFDTLHDFAILDAVQQPFYWLQSLDSEKIAFVLIKPQIFSPNYDPKLTEEDLKDIGLKSVTDEDALLFAIVNIPPDNQNKMSANLQGPVVINKSTREGKQLISNDAQWQVKHYIMEELAALKKEKAC